MTFRLTFLFIYVFSVFHFFVAKGQSLSGRPGSIGITGDTADVITVTQSGFLLAGGGKDVDAAMQWLLKRSGGGDVVILRSSGSTGYNDYLCNLEKVNSVETLFIDSRNLANNDTLVQIVRNAEAVFIAGGNQWNYINYWKDSKLNEALNDLISKKKIPIGGTSAGLAVLGEFYFDAANGSISSEEALKDPLSEKLSVGTGFLNIPILGNLITDSHYDARNRQGRHMAMLAKMYPVTGKSGKGLGVDEKTAVCLDEKGNLTIFGSGKAWFLFAGNKPPEISKEDQSLIWNRKGKAVLCYTIAGSKEGTAGGVLKKKGSLKNGTTSWYMASAGKFERVSPKKQVPNTE